MIKLNNEMRELEIREQKEIEVILANLSNQAAAYTEQLADNLQALTQLDFIFAKAAYSQSYKGSCPIFNNKGKIHIRDGRHPLLNPETVVPTTIRLGDDFTLLIITGPNTGGKTVSLKTTGLLQMMGQSGLHIPAFEGSELAVFDEIYADIGDEQSIEQSLSTFSSHMVKIVKIIEEVDSDSLALFDELGAGTDPTEGAALAISVLEHIRAFGASTVATTHYSELKVFALTTDGVENASCEFDVDSLQPTYKLLIGVPGKSNAFAISKRLGLSDAVISRAYEILSDEDVKFEDVITDLEQSRREAESERAYAKRMKQELSDLKAEIEAERKKVKESKARILEDARREAKIIIMEAKEESNAIIKDLERMRIEGKTANINEKVQKSRDKLKKHEESIDKQMKKSAQPRKTYREPIKNLKIGETVKLLDMDQTATVLKLPDSKGMVRIQAGIMKTDVHISNLERVKDNSAKDLADKYVRNTNAYQSKTKNVSTEVDVRGQLPEEALMNVEKFIDDCYLAGISPVTIIHGKGTGVLRSAVSEMLRRSKYVKSYRPGKFGEGEMGVTIVELK